MKKNNKDNKETDLIHFTKEAWDDNNNSVWLASTVNLYRNIEKFKFSVKLDAVRQRQIIEVISKDLLTSSLLSNPKLISAEQISPLEKEYLFEHFLSQQSFHQAHAGEAFIVDDNGDFLCSLNIGDHIRLELIDTEGELETTWNRLVAIETTLGKSVSYAFSPKYGFLTSDFNQCGTGLVISAFLQVPGLVHMELIDDVLAEFADESLYITGIQGNPTEIIGDIIVVQNNYTLGLTEENIIANLRSFITKIQIQENSIRSKILHEESADVKDMVSRSFGILIHSYQIETVEALNALSLLKLGLELGWVTGITLKEVNRLFFKCRRAHLIYQFGDQQPKQEELLHKRAEFIHKSLQKVKLTI